MKTVTGYILAILLLGANAYGRQTDGSIDQSSLDAELESAFGSGSPHGLDGRFDAESKKARTLEFLKTALGVTEIEPALPPAKPDARR